MITTYALIFVLKLMDSAIITSKSIASQNGKALLSSALVGVSSLLFFFVVAPVLKDNSTTSMIVVAVASSIGSYVSFLINNHFKKDSQFVNIISSNDRTAMKEFGDYMRTKQIKIITMESYGSDLTPTLTALVFANTREQSKKIDKFMLNRTEYLREIL